MDLGVLEGQTSRGLFSNSIFDPSVIGAKLHPVAKQLSLKEGRFTTLHTKEDSAEVTFGILIKIPHKNPLHLSPIWLGRIKMFSKFIFLCLQNMVSVQQEEYIILPHDCHFHPS